MMKKIEYNNFNLLRLFASLQVVYVHACVHLKIENSIALWIKDVISYFPGVPIFFLVSGYLITMSYEKNSNLQVYTKNRFLRIIPALYFCFFMTVLILFYYKQFEGVPFNEVIVWMIAQMTFVQFYNPYFIRDFGVGVVNGSLWTISVEIAFYVILPIIYTFLKKEFIKRFFLLISISLVFYYYLINISMDQTIYEKLLKVSILPYLFYFLIGLFIYRYIDFLKKYLRNKFLVYLAIYFLIIVFSFDCFIYLLLKQFILCFVVFSFVFSYEKLSYNLLKNNDYTYGIYIYHMLVINTLVHIKYLGELKYVFIVFIISIFGGVFSFHLIEQPFLKKKNKSLYNQINK